MNLSRYLSIVTLSLGLVGCTTVSLPGPPVSLSGKSRQAQLQQTQRWVMQGVAGIKTPAKAWSADLLWQQTSSHDYRLQLFGPLGINRVQLIGNHQQVTLKTSDQEVAAPDAETLVTQQLGWHLPVNHLYYWIRSLPVPELPAKQNWDSYHRLVSLEQDGWQIRYLNYMTVDTVDLPQTLVVSGPQLQLKIVISQWQLLPKR